MKIEFLNIPLSAGFKSGSFDVNIYKIYLSVFS